MVNKKFLFSLLTLLALFFNIVHADVKDGDYQVKVSLLKAYEDDYSMGNNAMLSDATLYVNNGTARLRVNFVPLEFNGFTGFLGSLSVNGTPATIISTYNDVDDYNNSENGIDARMKGKLYPRTLEFPIDLQTDIFPCTVYVPVMAEMGVGEQNARIKITYPEGFNEAVASTSDKSDKNDNNDNQDDDKNIPDDTTSDDNDKEKYYTVPIKLWHAIEDKASMGDGAMTNQANIYTTDGKMTLYVGSNKMTVSTITTSLINLYYDNGTEFVKATPYSYNMKIEGFDELRPEVFSLPIANKNEFLSVMVDPKVEPMGDDPIKARLKIDFANMKEISKDEATLIQKAINGKAKPEQKHNLTQHHVDKGISIDVPANAFNNNYTFYANQIRGEDLNKYKDNFDALDIIKGYKLSALGDLNTIPYDAKKPINNLRKPFQPTKKITITLPIEENAIGIKLYAFDGEAKKELEFNKEQNNIVFEYNKFEPFILVYKKDMDQTPVSLQNNNHNDDNLAKKSDYKDSVKNIMLNNKKTYESKGFIVFFILLMILISSLSIFFIKKHYTLLKRELYYAEQLKIRLQEKQMCLTKDKEA